MHRALVLVVLMAFGAAGQAQMIDDFESYADTTTLEAAWSFANLLDETTPNPRTGTQSLRRECQTVTGGGCASTREFDPPLDLREGELNFWFKLAEGSPAPSYAQVALEGANSGDCAFFSANISDTAWHRLEFRPDSTVDCPPFSSFDASDVVAITLYQFNASGSEDVISLVANFDDLEFFVFADGFESGGFSGWIVGPPPG